MASQNGHAEVARTLLAVDGSDANHANHANHASNDGAAALILASGHGHTEVVRALLAVGGIEDGAVVSDAEADRLAAEARKGVAAQERARVQAVAGAPVPRGLEDGHVKVKDGGRGRPQWLLLAFLLIGCFSCLAVGILIGVAVDDASGSSEDANDSSEVAVAAVSMNAMAEHCATAYDVDADPDQDASQYPVLCARIDIPTSIVDEPKRPGTLVLEANGSVVYSGTIGIETRGTSSQMFPKKQYGVETWDANHDDKKESLAGLPLEEDWIFHAPYSDKTLVHNVLAYDLARQMGRYASRCRWMVLSLNGQFQGIYVLMEKLKRDKHRINVAKNKAGDPTGGWVLKIDTSIDETRSWQFCSHKWHLYCEQFNTGTVSIGYDYPKPEDVTEAQKAYIASYFEEFETALSGESPTYADYIDIGSWVDYFMINELTKDVDAYRLSAYFHKDKGGKLKAGPVWDQNLGFGNADYFDGSATSGWAFANPAVVGDDQKQIPWWWPKLLAEPTFAAAVRTRWTELRNSTYSLANINALIDAYVRRLGPATINANFAKWGILSTYVWPNPKPYKDQTHAMYIDRLKTWIAQRVDWIDGAVLELPTTTRRGARSL